MTEKRDGKLAVVLGWVAGGGAGLLLSFVLFHALEEMPVEPVVFGLFLVGAFAGMAAADRLGDRAVKVLGIAAGVVLALGVAAVMVLSSAG